ncbi:MAG TPA: tetratricopeptide repeat protein [Candidatus Kapabacteria bacterium]|nr:tetratricopeptide repeat protein [Candidatus Kapabacteria bacterium]
MKKALTVVILLLVGNFILSSQELKIDKANELAQKGDYLSAIRAYTAILNKNPKDVNALLGRGLTYLYTEQSDSAITDFSRVILINPKVADAYNNRGLAFSYKQEMDSAFNDFNKAIELDSNFAEAYLNRAGIFLNIEKFDEALLDFSKAIKLNPKNPETYMQRARLYNKKKEYEKTISDYSNAIKYGIKNDEVYYLRANTYFKTENYQKAIEDYSTALKINSNNTNALNNRSIAYEKIGDTLNFQADRQLIEKIQLQNYNVPDLNKLSYKKFTNKDSSIIITLPDTWFQMEQQYEDVKRMLLSQDSLDPKNPSSFVGVELYIYSNMEKNYGVKDKEKILEFWKGSTAKNAKEYSTYTIQSQKMFRKNEFSGLLNKVFMQIDGNQPLTSLTEVVLAKDDFLFFAYFQVPEVVYKLYEEIIDKAVDSIIVK